MKPIEERVLEKLNEILEQAAKNAVAETKLACEAEGIEIPDGSEKRTEIIKKVSDLVAMEFSMKYAKWM